MNYLIANDVINIEFISESVKNKFVDFEIKRVADSLAIDMSGCVDFFNTHSHLSLEQAELIYSMQCYFFKSIDIGKLLIHAVTIVVDDWGYVFLGKAGMGKSTLAQQCIDYFDGDAVILNDDRTILDVGKDAVFAWRSPWSKISDSRLNAYYKIKAIAFLSQEKCFHIKQLNNIDGFNKIAEQYPCEQKQNVLSYCDKFLGDIRYWEIESSTNDWHVSEIFKVMNK